jgi:hypothetical protein
MLAKGFVGDINSQTITEEEEAALLSTKDPEENPAFFTEIFQQFTELLKEALADRNDLHQITNYLNSLEACDRTFTYRIGYAADGTATGFIWQTGVMRKDFELYGDVLFVDRLGQSLNDKGWPLITIAMLDGQRKVCLPCETLAITKSIDSYAWTIRMIHEMAPGRKLSDIKIIFADGIMAGETLLAKLGIDATCKLVLDHHHLLSEDIQTISPQNT